MDVQFVDQRQLNSEQKNPEESTHEGEQIQSVDEGVFAGDLLDDDPLFAGVAALAGSKERSLENQHNLPGSRSADSVALTTSGVVPLRLRRLPASFWQEPNVPRLPSLAQRWSYEDCYYPNSFSYAFLQHEPSVKNLNSQHPCRIKELSRRFNGLYQEYDLLSNQRKLGRKCSGALDYSSTASSSGGFPSPDTFSQLSPWDSTGSGASHRSLCPILPEMRTFSKSCRNPGLPGVYPPSFRYGTSHHQQPHPHPHPHQMFSPSAAALAAVAAGYASRFQATSSGDLGHGTGHFDAIFSPVAQHLWRPVPTKINSGTSSTSAPYFKRYHPYYADMHG